MYIRRNLAWLEGYPEEGDSLWHAMAAGDASRHLTLDRDLLRKSTRAISVILREFPVALPQLVGDTQRWASERRAHLGLLKQKVHQREALPASPIEAHPFAPNALRRNIRLARANHAELVDIIRAFEWVWWLDLKTLAGALNWALAQTQLLRRLSEQLGSTAPQTAIRLYQLSARHGQKRAAAMCNMFARAELWRFDLACPEPYLRQAMSALSKAGDSEARRKLPKPPKPLLAAMLVDWVAAISGLDAKTQRRSLDVFAILAPSLDFKGWSAWWLELEHAFKDAAIAPRADPKGRKKRKKTRGAPPKSVKRVEALQRQRPPAVPTKVFAALLRALPSAGNEKLFSAVMRAIEQWPTVMAGCAIRIALAVHWCELWKRSAARSQKTLMRVIAKLTGHAREHAFAPDSIAAWAPVWASLQKGGGPVYGIDDELLDELKSRAQLDTFFATLGDGDGDKVDTPQAEHLVQLCATFPAAAVKDAFDNLRDQPLAKHYVSPSLLKLAASATVAHPEKVAPLLWQLLNAEARGHADTLADCLQLSLNIFAAQGLTGELLRAICEGDAELVFTSAQRLGLLKSQKQVLPKVEEHETKEAHRSFKRYPEALQASLAQLQRFDAKAERTAGRILGKDFPAPEQINRELESLEARGELSDAQSRRCAQLRLRLAQPAAVSKKRLERLRKKLQSSAERQCIENWALAVERAFLSALTGYLGLAEPPTWLLDDAVVEVLAPIAGLPASSQELARRLLQTRAGPPPWDLRDAAANQAFIKSMQAKGLCLDAWLNPRTIAAKTDDGRKLSLSLEQDPLLVFRMGAHFQTCLAPGEFNFFSVFANAADINKQVMIARDGDGRVFGRVLLGLTDEGGLLPFQPYAHCRTTGFDSIAKGFVRDLAEEMGTIVVLAGSVSTLLAKRWYDDGPVDFTHRPEALRDGSAFRSRLKTIEPAELVPSLREALAPLALNELTLPMVLALPELAARPLLLMPLLPLARRTALPPQRVIALIRLMRSADDSANDCAEIRLDDRAAASWLHEVALRFAAHEDFGWPIDAVELLVLLDPLKALDLIRRTRPKELRNWKDDWDGWRLLAAAQAYEALSRRNRACALYELALKALTDRHSKQSARQALQRLRPKKDDPLINPLRKGLR